MKAITDYAQSKSYYAPSGPQLAGMYAGSIAAPFAIEPMFYPKDQGSITQQQLFQRYGTTQLMTNPRFIQELERQGQEKQVGTMTPVSPGTLYQYPNLAGNPMGGM